MYNTEYLAHHGVKGQKWGIRRKIDNKVASFKKWANTDVKDATTKQKITAITAGVGLGLVATGAMFVTTAKFLPTTTIGRMSNQVLNSGKNFVQTHIIGSSARVQLSSSYRSPYSAGRVLNGQNVARYNFR